MTSLVVVPKSVPQALQALDVLERDVSDAKTYEAIRQIERRAEALKKLFAEVDTVRARACKVIVVANYHIGKELEKAPVLKGRPAKSVTPSSAFTRTEQVGSRMKASRLIKLAKAGKAKVKQTIKEITKTGKDATVGAVVKAIAAEEGQQRREASRAALPLIDGMDLRIGDCRKVLADIPDNSVPLIVTDPPYGDEAIDLYVWLAGFAKRVLIPGGSLICYTGQSRLDRDMRILGEALRYWWLLIMPHHQSQRLPGKFVIAGFKPVLWHVKEFRRGRSLVPDMLKSPARDKELHNWGQGEGGVSALFEHLTDPGETIVDPFAGTAKWGRIAAGMGRRWIGADVVKGGAHEAVV